MDERKKKIVVKLVNWIKIIKIDDRGDRLIVEGLLYPGTNVDDILCELKEDVESIKTYKYDTVDVLEIILRKEKVRIPKVNIILFILTLLTTLLAGTMMAGENPFKNPLNIYKGIPFSFSLLLILGIHEIGHFLMAKKHGVEATLPYFIPAPTFIGTFGAVIRIKSPIQNRKALIEIGAAGPIAGFLVALPLLFIGLHLSDIVYNLPNTGLKLGESLIMKIAIGIVFPGLEENADIVLHPIAFAAWIGMIVTMLNLIPIGQLDGGHITYAIFVNQYNKIQWVAFALLILLGFFSLNWLVWAALVFFLIRMRHPPVFDYHRPLTNKEKIIGVIALIIFILTFVPIPFKV
ncbi:MAG: site-2 protease family protein [Candidatus Marinimicrobia bacterium]|nr:site-2 protease family protein [Candidatus Neomarinimicrobiota bacterium]